LMALIIEVDRSLDHQLTQNAGLSHFGYTALARLSEAENRSLRMSDLASTANGSLSRLSQVIAKLEKKGWVTRSADPDDGRYTVATLTEIVSSVRLVSNPSSARDVAFPTGSCS